MREQLADLRDRLAEDRAENAPSSPRERVLYVAEVWAAMGLFFRAACHAVLYSLRYEDADIHPLEMEYGLTSGLAVLGDARGHEPTHADARDIQMATGIFSTLLVIGVVSTVEAVPVAVVVALGPSAAVCVGDPFLGIWDDLGTAFGSSTEETHG